MSGLRFDHCPCCGCDRLELAFLNGSPAPIEGWRDFSLGGRRYIRDLHACFHCGFRFINEIEPNYVRHYQTQASDEGDRLVPFRRRYFDRIKTRILSRSSFPQDASFLDVGCAEGTWLSLWPSHRRVGAEYSAAHRAQLAAAGMEAISPEQIPTAGQFSVVSLFDVLEHLQDPRSALLSLRENVAVGGTLVLGVPDMGKIAARLLGSRYYLVCPMHFSYFTSRSLRSLLERVFPNKRIHIEASPPMEADLQGIVKWLPLGSLVPRRLNFAVPLGYSASLIATVI